MGKDIKIAIYDDMVEVTNPGKLLPSIDFDKMETRQSDIRNKVIAPVFKHLGLIDQWGNGLKLIYDELNKYEDIDFKWSENGLQFQVQFINKDVAKKKSKTTKITVNDRLNTGQVKKLLNCLEGEMSRIELQKAVNLKHRDTFIDNYIKPALEAGLVERTIPEKPKSRLQKYRLTSKGKKLMIKENKKK